MLTEPHSKLAPINIFGESIRHIKKYTTQLNPKIDERHLNI